MCSNAVVSREIKWQGNTTELPPHLQILRHLKDLLWVQWCPHQIYAEVPTPRTSEHDLIWKQSLCKGNQSKMCSLGWALIVRMGIPIERGYLDLETHTGTQGEDSGLQAKETGLGQVIWDRNLQSCKTVSFHRDTTQCTVPCNSSPD